MSQGKHSDYILPWIFKLVQTGRVGGLQQWVRESLSRSLYEMISDPDEKGVLAAQLHERVSKLTNS